MSKELSTKTTIRNLTAEIKKSFVKKDAFTPVQIAAEKAIKSVGVTGNTISFFASTDKTGTAAFTVDFPTEMFLDQTKTEFVPSFAFSETTYPGATDPKLEGKPVMVLAVKGENPNSCTYSFLSMAALVDTYKAKATSSEFFQRHILVPYILRVSIAVVNRFKLSEWHDRRFARNADHTVSVRRRFRLQLRVQNILQSLCTVIVGRSGKAVHIRFGHFCLSGQNALLQARHQFFCDLHAFHILRGADNGVLAHSVFFCDSVAGFAVVDQVRF